MPFPKYDPKNPELLDSIVCFADILGFSSLISEGLEDGTDQELLKGLHKLLLSEYKQLKELNPYASFKAFTDNIILAYPLFEDGEGQSGGIFMSFSDFQLNLTLKGHFIRGGISLNKYYGDDQFSYGPALIEAHHLESKLAVYPRIILSDRMVDLVKHHIQYYLDGPFPQDSELLIDNTDNQWFVNYLSLEETQLDVYIEQLKRHKKIIVDCLKEYSIDKNERVHMKYRWSAEYHNYFCDQFIRHNNIEENNLLIDKFGKGKFSRISEII